MELFREKKNNLIKLILLLPIFFNSGCFNNEQISANQQDPALDKNFINLLDSVVRIDVWERDYVEGRKSTTQGQGSGTIVDKEGHILTNAHVANIYTEKVMITLASLEQVPATFIGWDHWTDLAVLKLDIEVIKNKNIKFSYAGFGDSDKLYPGKTVYAVGTPHGLARTVTRGIISNTDRFFDKEFLPRGHETGFFNTWIQTDAAINPGNSGGPLVTEDGLIIGVNTRGATLANNLGFAVPGNVAKKVMEKIINKGTITRSYIGIVPVALYDFENSYNLTTEDGGLLIDSVDPGSPASKSNLRPGDIVLKINGDKVDGAFPEQLPAIQNKIASYPIGSNITLNVMRGEKELEIVVTTEQLESRAGDEYAFEQWGMSIRKLTNQVARDAQLDSSTGCTVIGLQSNFPAANAGLQQSDIIIRINNKELNSIDDLKSIYDEYLQTKESMLFEVQRNYQIVYLVLKTE